MKLEQNEKRMLFNMTEIPDIFFSEYLTNIPGDYLKIYLYISFLSFLETEPVSNATLISVSFKTISNKLK